jgi:hypothetical protein
MSFALLPNKKWPSFLFEFTKRLYKKRMTTKPHFGFLQYLLHQNYNVNCYVPRQLK